MITSTRREDIWFHRIIRMFLVTTKIKQFPIDEINKWMTSVLSAVNVRCHSIRSLEKLTQWRECGVTRVLCVGMSNIFLISAQVHRYGRDSVPSIGSREK
jgi:hypothetical protein